MTGDGLVLHLKGRLKSGFYHQRTGEDAEEFKTITSSVTGKRVVGGMVQWSQFGDPLSFKVLWLGDKAFISVQWDSSCQLQNTYLS